MVVIPPRRQPRSPLALGHLSLIGLVLSLLSPLQGAHPCYTKDGHEAPKFPSKASLLSYIRAARRKRHLPSSGSSIAARAVVPVAVTPSTATDVDLMFCVLLQGIHAHVVLSPQIQPMVQQQRITGPSGYVQAEARQALILLTHWFD